MSPQENPWIRSVFTVDAQREGLRAEEFLALVLPRLSRSRIRQKIQQGQSLLNRRRYATSARLAVGDVVEVLWRDLTAPGDSADIQVLYEDDFLLAVDKPAGMTVHPAGGVQSGTLIQGIRARYRGELESRLERGDREVAFTLIHRLDRLTSGAVLVAKDKATHDAFQRLLADGGLEKCYTAVVEGTVEPPDGSIDRPIGPAEGSIRIQRAVREDGLPAMTRYRTIRQGRETTLLHAWPLTGRQHQIRVHLAFIGHPVVGDLLYKDPSLFLRAQAGERGPGIPERHLLHALSVSFLHPRTGEPLRIVSSLPRCFDAAAAED